MQHFPLQTQTLHAHPDGLFDRPISMYLSTFASQGLGCAICCSLEVLAREDVQKNTLVLQTFIQVSSADQRASAIQGKKDLSSADVCIA